ncbi:hypothetical protein [Burkholderia sp. PU8-34]
MALDVGTTVATHDVHALPLTLVRLQPHSAAMPLFTHTVSMSRPPLDARLAACAHPAAPPPPVAPPLVGAPPPPAARAG